MRTLHRLLCSLGLRHVSDRRWLAVGWVGYCARCGAKQTGLHP